MSTRSPRITTVLDIDPGEAQHQSRDRFRRPERRHGPPSKELRHRASFAARVRLASNTEVP
jgi:hypothetical protein